MTKEERKQLRKRLEKRLLAGESKAAIYNGFDDELEADLVAVALAQIPTPERRTRFRLLNWLLIASLGSVCASKLTTFGMLVLNGELAGAGFDLLVPAVLIFLILLAAGYRGLGYPLIVIFCLPLGGVALFDFEKSTGSTEYILQAIFVAGVMISILLALFLKRNLLPNTHFFIMPKSDTEGRPVFEDEN